MVAAAQLPRLGAHLRDEGVHPTMFCSHWFITLFAYTLPFGALAASLKALAPCPCCLLGVPVLTKSFKT